MSVAGQLTSGLRAAGGRKRCATLFAMFVMVWTVLLPALPAAAVPSASSLVDAFDRIVADGWGDGDAGAAWRRAGGQAVEYYVDGAEGVHDVTGPGSSRNSWLDPEVRDIEVRYRFKTDKAAGGEALYQSALLRLRNMSSYYGARLKLFPDGRVSLAFTRRLTTETFIGDEVLVARERHAAGAWYQVRVQVEGSSPTLLRAKVWRDGTGEPVAWDLERADAQGLTLGDGAGVRSITHSREISTPVRYSYDDFSVRPIGVVLHVDPANGSDANAGAAASPFRTLQKALNVVQPGMTIRLASGVYQEVNQTVASGTALDRITIEPEPGASPILDGKANTLNAMRIVNSYYTVRGLDIRNTKEGVRLEGVTGVIFENNLVHHVNNEGIRLRYFAIGNTVRNNIIYGCGLNGNGEGIYIGNSPEQRYKNNGQPDTSSYNVVSGNELYDVEEGIDIKEDSTFNVISGNRVHDVIDPNSGGFNVRGDGNYLYDNVSYDNAGAGFRLGGDITYSPIHGDGYHYGVNNVLRGNVAYGNAGHGYKFMNGPQDADLSNSGSGNGGKLYYYAGGVAPFVG